MKSIKVLLIPAILIILLGNSAFATTSSQILIMSNQLYAIARDLTTGMFPTALLLIAIGMKDMVLKEIKDAQGTLADAEQA